MSGHLFIVSAPSGAGKTTLTDLLLKQHQNLWRSISHTTRPPRKGEISGKDYHFVQEPQFQTMMAQNEFLEFAHVHNDYYGTAYAEITSAEQNQLDLFLVIDYQGALKVRKKKPDATWIFLLPPSLKVLEQRLHLRGLDDNDSIQRRLKNAEQEILHARQADYLVVNDRIEHALADLSAIIQTCRLKSSSAAHLTSLEKQIKLK